MAGSLAPFSTVIKARDVEDPINCWLHRPLAYGLIALVHRTPVTPNQITLLAIICGVAAGALWIGGSPTSMVWGGALLWASSILDGADGILARAKDMHTELGRALDGSADMLVAIVTVFGSFYHLWDKHHDLVQLAFMPFALVTAVIHIYLYDYFKESYLNSTNLTWDGRTPGLAAVRARLERARAQNAPLVTRFAWASYVGMLTAQARLRRLTDPRAGREHLHFTVSEETIRIHRMHNYWPMQLWTLVSLCPHSYLMSIAGMFDRLDIYLWFRVAVANSIFLAAVLWQRVASRRTLEDLERTGAKPQPITTP